MLRLCRGYSVFLNIFQPDDGCTVIVKSAASTNEEGCGYTIGQFQHAACVNVVLKKTFMVQHCCGISNCIDAGTSAPDSTKMIRGLEHRRNLESGTTDVKKRDGQIIQSVRFGFIARKQTPQRSNSLKAIARRGDDKSCKTYVPDGEIYTRPADAPQILFTVRMPLRKHPLKLSSLICLQGADGSTTGSEITITEERSVSQSTTFSAGINIEVISASTEISFEETITNGKERKWTVPANQLGVVGFTPTLKCTKGKFSPKTLRSTSGADTSQGSLECSDGTFEGETCTGFNEADEIAGTYAVIAKS